MIPRVAFLLLCAAAPLFARQQFVSVPFDDDDDFTLSSSPQPSQQPDFERFSGHPQPQFHASQQAQFHGNQQAQFHGNQQAQFRGNPQPTQPPRQPFQQLNEFFNQQPTTRRPQQQHGGLLRANFDNGRLSFTPVNQQNLESFPPSSQFSNPHLGSPVPSPQQAFPQDVQRHQPQHIRRPRPQDTFVVSSTPRTNFLINVEEPSLSFVSRTQQPSSTASPLFRSQFQQEQVFDNAPRQQFPSRSSGGDSRSVLLSILEDTRNRALEDHSDATEASRFPQEAGRGFPEPQTPFPIATSPRPRAQHFAEPQRVRVQEPRVVQSFPEVQRSRVQQPRVLEAFEPQPHFPSLRPRAQQSFRQEAIQEPQRVQHNFPQARAQEPQRFQERGFNQQNFAQEPRGFQETNQRPRGFSEADEEEIFRQQAENAHYSFASQIDDTISGNQHQREEIREGNTVRGMYSYSDGYVKRTVFYEADDKGYRVVKEEEEPLGDGPQVNPRGQANVSAFIAGNALQYSITSDDIQVAEAPKRRF